MTAGCAEQPALAVLDNGGSVDVGAQCLGERVMARHGVLLAAFLMQPDCPSGTAWPEVLDLHLQRRVDAREAIATVYARVTPRSGFELHALLHAGPRTNPLAPGLQMLQPGIVRKRLAAGID